MRLFLLLNLLMIVGVAATVLVLLNLLLARGGSLGLVNSVEEAKAFVRSYHAGRSGPFTSREEGELIRRVMRKFSLGEETAAYVVADEWPGHREWRPEVE